MSPSLALLVTAAAVRDVRREAIYLQDEGRPGVDQRFIEAVDRTMQLLRTAPKMGSVFEDRMRDGRQLRYVPVTGVFGRRLIFYSQGESFIQIERVLHRAREMSRLLR